MLNNFDHLDTVFSAIHKVDINYIEGIIPLIDEKGNVIYEYNISIDFSNNYPKAKELDELIPHNIDRHLYPNNDWVLCLEYPISLASFWISSGFDCVLFVRKKLIPYLANQLYYDRNGIWLVDGLKHGVQGTIDYYSGIYKTTDKMQIIRRIEDIVMNRKIRPNDLCFCGSGLKYKKCHSKRPLTPVEVNLIQNDYKYLKSSTI